MKLKVVGYGNCQIANVLRILACHPEFAERYDVAGATILGNATMIEAQSPIPYDVIAAADMLLYQPTADRHGPYATSKLLTYCKPGCITVSFPYLYNYAFWEVLVFPLGDSLVGHSATRYAHLNHEPIARLKRQGLSFDAIHRKILARDMDWDFARRYTETQAILRTKEAECDVKVAAFIDAHFRDTLLFYTQNHPTTPLLAHVARQALQRLGLDPSQLPADLPLPDYAPGDGAPVFPIGWFAWKHFGFTFMTEPAPNTFPFIIWYAKQIYDAV